MMGAAFVVWNMIHYVVEHYERDIQVHIVRRLSTNQAVAREKQMGDGCSGWSNCLGYTTSYLDHYCYPVATAAINKPQRGPQDSAMCGGSSFSVNGE